MWRVVANAHMSTHNEEVMAIPAAKTTHDVHITSTSDKTSFNIYIVLRTISDPKHPLLLTAKSSTVE